MQSLFAIVHLARYILVVSDGYMTRQTCYNEIEYLLRMYVYMSLSTYRSFYVQTFIYLWEGSRHFYMLVWRERDSLFILAWNFFLMWYLHLNEPADVGPYNDEFHDSPLLIGQDNSQFDPTAKIVRSPLNYESFVGFSPIPWTGGEKEQLQTHSQMCERVLSLPFVVSYGCISPL